MLEWITEASWASDRFCSVRTERHYGDGLYREAANILGLEEQTLRVMKSMAERFELLTPVNNLSWWQYLVD